MAATTAIVIGALAAVGTSAYQVKTAEDGKHDARRDANKREDTQRRLEEEARGREANEESDANVIATRDAARKRQRSAAGNGQGRRDTILTSPLGVVGAADNAKKDLLGA